MYTLLTPHGTAYATVPTAADVVRRQSKGLGSSSDVERVAAADHGPVESDVSFRVGVSAGRAVAIYRFVLDRSTE